MTTTTTTSCPSSDEVITTAAPTTTTTAATTTSKRRRQRNDTNNTLVVRRRGIFQQIACLWNPAVVPADAPHLLVGKQHNALRSSSQRSASTFIGDDDEEEDDTASVGSTAQDDNDLPLLPPEDAPPAVWLDYYYQVLPTLTDWTERANLYYTVAHLHVQCNEYEAATRAFEKEAAVLQGAGVIKGEALVAIFESCAAVWQVRSPTRALHYYEICLQYCTNLEQAQTIRHAMGRLYFQTGNLERAMQVMSIGGSSSSSGTTTTTARTRRASASSPKISSRRISLR